MLTNWGYEIESETLPDMLTVEEFNAATGNQYAAQDVEGQIHAAQSAIRDWCGWHVYPELSCTFTDDSLPKKRVIQLPATHVSAVDSAAVDGAEVSFKAKRNGLVSSTFRPARTIGRQSPSRTPPGFRMHRSSKTHRPPRRSCVRGSRRCPVRDGWRGVHHLHGFMDKQQPSDQPTRRQPPRAFALQGEDGGLDAAVLLHRFRHSVASGLP